MSFNDKISAPLYAKMLRQGTSRLGECRGRINDLNVFPIPDGDTGDNMYLTIRQGVQATGEGSASLEETARAASKGMLLGARGNSGVILSRIFAGIARGFEGMNEASLQQFAHALKCGVEESYGAVPNPVEGTILTVWREGVQEAVGDNVEQYLSSLIQAMEKSLRNTPELLPVLKQAGVVDSGGAGLLCIAEGMLDAVKGISTDAPDAEAAHTPEAKSPIDLDKFGPDTPLEYGYCTEFLLRLQNAKTDLSSPVEEDIKAYLMQAGESVVCFRDGSIVKAHVHTKTPGDILNHCQKWGEFLTLKIENMTLQHNGLEKEEEKEEEKPNEPKQENDTNADLFAIHKPYAIVQVGSGEGLISLMKEAGADAVIEGGQTMNPSTQDFLDAFRSLNADAIIVFPNNSNVILSARQAASLYTKVPVTVIPSKDPLSGFVAMSALDRDCRSTEEVEQMALGMLEGTRAGSVAKASRDSLMDDITTREGDYIGIAGGKIRCAAPSAKQVITQLVNSMLEEEESEMCLVLTGADCTDADLSELEMAHPRTEFRIEAGLQPVFDYIFVLC